MKQITSNPVKKAAITALAALAITGAAATVNAQDFQTDYQGKTYEYKEPHYRFGIDTKQTFFTWKVEPTIPSFKHFTEYPPMIGVGVGIHPGRVLANLDLGVNIYAPLLAKKDRVQFAIEGEIDYWLGGFSLGVGIGGSRIFNYDANTDNTYGNVSGILGLKLSQKAELNITAGSMAKELTVRAGIEQKLF
jgi:hypothetical protein